MQDQIYSIYHLSIAPSDFDAFEALIQPIIAATSEEADTSIYEYVANADRNVVHIVERYRTQGLFGHASLAPLSLAWEAFDPKNGNASLAEMRATIVALRRESPPTRLPVPRPRSE
jgi:hypothetical protein